MTDTTTPRLKKTCRILAPPGIVAACAKENSRYAISGVYVIPGGQEKLAQKDYRGREVIEYVWLAATDGRMAAIQKAEGQVSEPLIAPVEAFLGKAKHRPDVPRDCLLVEFDGQRWSNGAGRLVEMTTEDGTVGGKFPPIADVLPHMTPTDADDYLCAALNPDLLAKLHKAIDGSNESRSLTLMIRKPKSGGWTDGEVDSPILVRCEQGGIGLLMPTATNRQATIAHLETARGDFARWEVQSRHAPEAGPVTAKESPVAVKKSPHRSAQATAPAPAPAAAPPDRVPTPAQPPLNAHPVQSPTSTAGQYKIELTAEVRDVLRRSEMTATALKLPGQLKRKLYESVNKVIVAVGGKWNKEQKCHLFTDDPRPALGLAVAMGELTDKKREYQQFFTPTDLAQRMANMVSLAPDMFVLEPSAGDGRIADVIAGYGIKPHCIEVDPALAAKLKAKGYFSFCGDFLGFDPTVYGKADRILMNPPFSNPINSDIEHVLHALKFLKPGGRLIAIMSPHYTFAEDKASIAFRKLVGQWGYSEPLPEGTFTSEGTNVNAVLVTLTKPAKKAHEPEAADNTATAAGISVDDEPNPIDVVTPAMRQYHRFKKQHPESLLLLRMGDFYEAFAEDARVLNKVCGCTLTQRSGRPPMAGVPYHSVETYLNCLVKAGHRVVLCEQIDKMEAFDADKLEVARVVTQDAPASPIHAADISSKSAGCCATISID